MPGYQQCWSFFHAGVCRRGRRPRPRPRPRPEKQIVTGRPPPGSLRTITTGAEGTMQDVTAGTGGTTGSGSVATDETDRLIASNKVEGTAVYDRQGERLGTVYNFMVDKRSGQVA